MLLELRLDMRTYLFSVVLLPLGEESKIDLLKEKYMPTYK